jgi:hypothetical protein
MDEVAVGAVERAECELGNTKRECAGIEARVERARRGDFDGADKFRESGGQDPPNGMKEGEAPQQSGSNTQLANTAPNEPIQPQVGIDPSPVTSPFVIPSMSNSTADSDDFSVVSNPQPEAADTSHDQESISNPSDHPEVDSVDDSLTLMVQRYTDICYERRTLLEEIENRLERKERMAVEKLTCAKIALETTRQKAVEIVAALNDASGGETVLKLPAGVLGPIDHKPISPTGNGACASGSGPIVGPSTVHHVPVFNPVKAHEPAISTPLPKKTPLPASTGSGQSRTTFPPAGSGTSHRPFSFQH